MKALGFAMSVVAFGTTVAAVFMWDSQMALSGLGTAAVACLIFAVEAIFAGR